MFVPSYQMHNVLNVYAKRLERSAVTRTKENPESAPPSDRIALSAEGKRQSVIDKVAATIVDRITRFGPQNEVDQQIVDRLKEDVAGRDEDRSTRFSDFRFNRIDSGSQKRTDSLKVDDGGFVFKRLEQLARETVDRQMVSTRSTEDPARA